MPGRRSNSQYVVFISESYNTVKRFGAVFATAGKMIMRMLRAVFEFERDPLIERSNPSIVRSLAEGTALSHLSAMTRNDACDAAAAAGRRRPALLPFGIHDII